MWFWRKYLCVYDVHATHKNANVIDLSELCNLTVHLTGKTSFSTFSIRRLNFLF